MGEFADQMDRKAHYDFHNIELEDKIDKLQEAVAVMTEALDFDPAELKARPYLADIVFESLRKFNPHSHLLPENQPGYRPPPSLDDLKI